jgi:hypothetical protein
MKTIDQLINSSKSAEIVIKYFARYKSRYRKEPTRFSRFKKALRLNGTSLSLEEIQNVFLSLETLGYGKVVYFRTQPLKFIWNTNYVELARTTLRELQKAPVKAAKPALNRNTLIVVLPGGKQATIDVPKNLKSGDIKNLISSIKNLA